MHGASVPQGEFHLIDAIRKRATLRADVTLGIGDDAALLRLPADHELVVTTDTLNIGVHFLAGAAPADLGWKALAVNLSDLAAMGALPAWCTLALSLPQADADWLDAFLDGFFELAQRHDVALVGGDITRGPLSITVTAHGFLPEGRALRRDGARVEDDVWITGTLGDASAALALQGRAGAWASADDLLRRLHRPTPRITVGLVLRGLAHACIDVSDGLLADLGHVCAASAVGAEIAIAQLPASDALTGLHDGEARWALQLAGGDDYELCFTAAVADREAVRHALASVQTPGTIVGRIIAGDAVRALTPDGEAWTAPRTGYMHFAAAT